VTMLYNFFFVKYGGISYGNFFLVELILRVKAWSSQVLYFGRFEQGILKKEVSLYH
jgi:hypothetical protein